MEELNAKINLKISESAIVAKSASLANNVKVWEYAQIRERVTVGENTIIGSYVYVDAGVSVGNNCKIQSKALVFHPAIIHDGVFIGPAAVLTNDRSPRALNLKGTLKSEDDWEKVGVIVEYGASIGAGAICIAPVRIGTWALIGAGAVVTNDVPAFALVAGNPAKQIGWVGRHGYRLQEISKELFQCPKSGLRYKLHNELMVEMEN
jgi:UDP-2-acetamido-3-amino-2,3-dideoxy-glucuronate N-acetyltransferase